MAQPNYTYDDFLSYLPQQGLSEADFSPEDLALAKSNPNAGVKLMEYKVNWKNAKTDDERALINSEANTYRQSVGGVDSGIDGNFGNSSLTPDDMVQSSMPSPQSPTTQPIGQTSFGGTAPTYQAPQSYNNQYAGQQNQLLGDMMNYQPFQYGEYNNQYAGQQDQMLNDITGYKPFEFDADTNPQMQAYTKQYAREGNRAMQDALGSMSAATGGMPSTAAATAMGQANDYYMGQLNDKLPQIYESEYNKYLSDFGMLQDKFSTLNGIEQTDYSRYWDGKNFDYGKYLDDFGRMDTNLDNATMLERADRSDYDSERNFGLDLYGQQSSNYNANRTFDYGQDYDNKVWARDEEQTTYNRGQDAKEAERIAANDEWEKQYKFDAQTADAEQTEFNRMMDMWKAAGRANNQVAQYFGVAANTAYGGEETELAIEQARANIAQTNKQTQYIGVDTGGNGGGGGGADDPTAAAWTAYYNGTATPEQLLLIGGGEPPEPEDAIADEPSEWDPSLYDAASLKQYGITDEASLDAFLEQNKDKYTLGTRPNGKLYIQRFTH